ncbi:MAG: hypothetical protein N2507_01310 [Candidatus Bipolaricaulota bacterium]|nr:hypothetical protein [Candidatus Bipolaricaulota bacterium]
MRLLGLLVLVAWAGWAAEVRLQESPFGLSLAWEGRELVRLGQGGRPAFYVQSWPGRVELRRLLSVREEPTGRTLVFRTSDGRRAEVAVSHAQEGTVRLTFRVEGKARWERLGVVLEVTPDEGFYGLLECPTQGLFHEFFPPRGGDLDLRGQTVWLYTLPTHALYAPFFVSSRGWGLWVESSWPGIFRFGTRKPTEVTLEYEGPALTLRLIPGPTPLEAVARYARLTGTTVLPPRWALGIWRWRDEVFAHPTLADGTPNPLPFNSMVVEDVLWMEALGVKPAVYVLDRPWAEGTLGYGNLQFDPQRFPHAGAMVRWLREKGIMPVLWVGPWLLDGLRREAEARGFTVRRVVPFPPGAALLDFTHPQAVAWWQEKLRPLVELGIAGFKLDRGEESTPDGLLLRGSYHDGTDYRAGHNLYPLWFAQAARGVFARAGVAEFVLYYRAGWTGSAAVTLVWGGDPHASFWGLRESILALQRAAALNFPLWGSNTGGYVGRPTRELFARWLAFSCFSPLMDLGPLGNLAPWAWAPDGAPAPVGPEGYGFRPYWDEELVALLAFYGRLRQDLVDYLYALAEEAHRTGLPLVRPMALAYPEEGELRRRWDQYLLGPDLLVRPVWEAGAKRVRLRLPPGRWYDPWTGRTHTGPAELEVDVPLHRIPLWVREGSPLGAALGDLEGRWARVCQEVRGLRPK